MRREPESVLPSKATAAAGSSNDESPASTGLSLQVQESARTGAPTMRLRRSAARIYGLEISISQT